MSGLAITSIVLGTFFLVSTRAFSVCVVPRCPQPRLQQQQHYRHSIGLPRPYYYRVVHLRSGIDDFNEKEVQAMDDLIISISMEPTDESRRERLTKVFEEEMAKPNGAPQHFSDLFGHALIIVGDRVKAEASEKAEQMAANSEENQEAEKGADGYAADEEPFAQQRQLWALVDMMIQSRVIVKKASGELGSKGAFQ